MVSFYTYSFLALCFSTTLFNQIFVLAEKEISAHWDPAKVNYPFAYRSNITFEYPSLKKGKVFVADPYNWMEKSIDENVELQKYVQKQDSLAKSYLDQCTNKAKITDKIRKGFDITKYQQLTQYGTQENPVYLYSVKDQSHLSLRWFLANQQEMDQAKSNGYDKPPGMMIIDEQTLSTDGSAYIENWDIRDSIDLAAFSVIYDGDKIDSEIRFLKLSSSTVESAYTYETLQHGGAQSFFFTPDGKGIIYDVQRLGDNKNPNSQVYYHELGKDPKEDVTLVNVDQSTKINRWNVELSNDKQWLVLTGVNPTEKTNTFYLTSIKQDLNAPDQLEWISISSDHSSRIRYTTNVNNDFYLLTNMQNATMFKVITATINPIKAQKSSNLNQLPVLANFNQNFIPERKDSKIQAWIVLSSKKLILFYLNFANIHFELFDLKSGKFEKRLLNEFDGEVFSASSKFNQGFIETSSFLSGSLTYKVTLTPNGEVITDVALDGGPKGIDTSAYQVKQFAAKSEDGTLIPFSILCKKDHKFDGKGTAWLYFFGSYGINWFSAYDPFLLPWVDNFGGIFVYIQARGGSELGPKWHQEGMLGNRQNTFDDVHAVIKYLIDKKIAGFGKIILEGYGAGGEVAMVVTNQSPEGMIGTVLLDRGIYDMLRIVEFPYAQTQIEEWGDPRTPQGFDWIYPYSPLHHVNPNKPYPAILITPAQNDTIVNNMHSYKMIATLQYLLPKNPKPLLLDLIPNEGARDSQQPLETRIFLGTIKQCFASLSLDLNLINSSS